MQDGHIRSDRTTEEDNIHEQSRHKGGGNMRGLLAVPLMFIRLVTRAFYSPLARYGPTREVDTYNNRDSYRRRVGYGGDSGVDGPQGEILSPGRDYSKSTR